MTMTKSRTLPAIFTSSAATELGLSRRKLQGKHFTKVSNGIYQYTEPSYSEKLKTFTEAMPKGTIFSISAAHLHGIRLPYRYLKDFQVYIALPSSNRGFRRHNVKTSRKKISPQDIELVDDVPCTTLLRTIFDLARVLNDEELICMVEGVLVHHEHRPAQRIPRTTKEELLKYLQNHAGKYGVARLKVAIWNASEHSDSWQETRLRLLFAKYHYENFEVNKPVYYPDGSIAFEPDLGDFTNRISIQYEGEHHGTQEQNFRDLGRENKARSLGWTEVRIYHDDLNTDVLHEGRALPRAIVKYLLAKN